MEVGPYTLSFIGASQGVLLAALFLFRKNFHPAVRMLGLFLLVLSLGLLENYVQQSTSGMVKTIVTGFLGFTSFLYGPLLFCFVDMLTDTRPRFKRRYLYYMLPFFIGVSLCLFTAVTSENNRVQEDGLLELVLFEILVFQMLWYNLLAIRRLKKHRKEILDIYSNMGSRDLNWLRIFFYFITGTYVFSFLITHFVVFGFRVEQLYMLVQFAILLVIYLTSYYILCNPAVLQWNNTNVSNSRSTDVVPVKYQRSGLKADQATDYVTVLLAYMQDERPFLNPELSIHTLSDKLNISRNHLTQVINEQLGKNFNEFVNYYRVKEAKIMICDPQYSHLTLSAIGLEAGFNSKTTFNINFKKFTGFTPSEWKMRKDMPGFELAEVSK